MYNLVPKKKAKAFKQQEKAGPFIYLFLDVRPPSYSNLEERMPQTTFSRLCSIGFSNDVYSL